MPRGQYVRKARPSKAFADESSRGNAKAVASKSSRETPKATPNDYDEWVGPAKAEPSLGEDNLPQFLVCELSPMGGCNIVFVSSEATEALTWRNQKRKHANVYAKIG